MKIIAFSFNFWQYPVLMSIFQFIQTSSSLNFKPKSIIMLPILSALSQLFAVFQEDISLILKSRAKKEKDLRKQSRVIKIKIEPAFTFSRIQLISKRKIYLSLLLFALGFVNLFPHALYMEYAAIEELSSFQSFLNIIFTTIFCYFILKTQLFIHHYVAMLIFAIDISLYLGVNFKFLNDEINKQDGWGIFFLLTLGYIIPTSIREVLEKYLMQTYYITSPIILLFEGTFALIVFIVYLVIIQFIQCSRFSHNEILERICLYSQWAIVKEDIILNFNYSTIQTLFAWIYFISVYFASLFRVETINKLSPTHRFVGEILFQLYWFIYNLIIGDTINILALELVQVVLLLFASFLFNEFIIIQLCNLHYYTRNEIAKRASQDRLMAIEATIMGNYNQEEESEDEDEVEA